MNILPKGNLTLLKFKALDAFDFINHTVSTRGGGVSTLPGLESLNLGSSTKDFSENIQENYRRFCTAAGYDVSRIVLGKQTHSTNVRYATETDCGKGVFRKRDYTDVDALITDVHNLPLVIHTADCVPVSFVDIKRQVIGNAHCGWRGTFGRLSEKTIVAMQHQFLTNPRDLFCTIGPCICQTCYEVSQALYLDFVKKFGNTECTAVKSDKYYLDLAGINRQILLECGVSEENIIVSDLCTCCNTDYLYSHRGQGPQRGILASVISLI